MNAEISLKFGNAYPYDGPVIGPQGWEAKAARGIIADLHDRQGIKFGFDQVDPETRREIVQRMAEIIRLAQELGEQ